MVLPLQNSRHPIYKRFSPVDGEGFTKSVACQIEDAILKGVIKPGEKLPPERELQTAFQTGRGVIREALQELKQKGLLETRRGGKAGTFVKEVDATEASEPLALMIRQQAVPLKDMIEFRECIDRSVTILAIARGRRSQFDGLLQGAAELEAAALVENPSMKRIARIDRRLNLDLAKMTRNPMFEYIMKTIQIGFGSYDHVLYENSYYREKTVNNWLNTARAIAAREPMQALSCIGYHYVLLNRCISESGDIRQRRAVPRETTAEMD